MKSSLYKIRLHLHNMEKQLGLSQLTSAERDVLYAIRSLMENHQDIATHQILSHDLMENISRPTVYRAINRLLEENLIVKSTLADRGFFTIPSRYSELAKKEVLRIASSAMLAQVTASKEPEHSLIT